MSFQLLKASWVQQGVFFFVFVEGFDIVSTGNETMNLFKTELDLQHPGQFLASLANLFNGTVPVALLFL